jgi:hypothetical protein
VDLFPDSKELLELFLARDVRFLVIGGHALAAHGIPRGTDDFDLWVWAEHGNAVKITDALDKFGFASVGITPADLEDAWRDRFDVPLDGMTIPVISCTHLVINKWTTGRPQDLVDLMKLVRQAQRE